jgi:hypothetical protein
MAKAFWGWAKWAWVGAIAAVVAAGASVVGYVKSSPKPPAPTATASVDPLTHPNIDIPPPIPNPPLPDLSFELDRKQFGVAITGLAMPTIRLVDLDPDGALAPPPYGPPPVELPQAVAAASALPVAVEVRQGQNVYAGATTVGRVYQTLPQAREQIEDRVREMPDRSASHIRVDIDVDAGFARATFHIH